MATSNFENVIIVTRKTELEELVARFNTLPQAKFYLQQAGQAFEPIEVAHRKQRDVLERLVQTLPSAVKHQLIDRETVPSYTFGEDDLVLTVGQDGLVSNTAKYLTGQPVLAVNPDPERFDGILLPYTVDTMESALHMALYEEVRTREVTLASARLNDGQSLLAFNDFFIGARSHVSARYRLRIGEREELQSSSGIIVSTGAGSTGWLQSVYAGAAGVVEALGGTVIPPPNGGRMDWAAEQLVFSVREPFPSVSTGTELVHGICDKQRPLQVTSKMSSNGVIFSDGVEADYLEFNSGAELTISIADKRAQLVFPD